MSRNLSNMAGMNGIGDDEKNYVARNIFQIQHSEPVFMQLQIWGGIHFHYNSDRSDDCRIEHALNCNVTGFYKMPTIKIVAHVAKSAEAVLIFQSAKADFVPWGAVSNRLGYG